MTYSFANIVTWQTFVRRFVGVILLTSCPLATADELWRNPSPLQMAVLYYIKRNLPIPIESWARRFQSPGVVTDLDRPDDQKKILAQFREAISNINGKEIRTVTISTYSRTFMGLGNRTPPYDTQYQEFVLAQDFFNDMTFSFKLGEDSFFKRLTPSNIATSSVDFPTEFQVVIRNGVKGQSWPIAPADANAFLKNGRSGPIQLELEVDIVGADESSPPKLFGELKQYSVQVVDPRTRDTRTVGVVKVQ